MLSDLSFRRVSPSGALVRAESLRARVAAPPTSAATSEEADAWLAAAEAVRDRLAAGWSPADTVLAGAPLIDDWQIVVVEGGVALMGRVAGHPSVRAGRVTITSLVLAFDGRLAVWARTISRFYALGRPAGRAPSS